MKTMICLTSALVLSLSLPAAADAQNQGRGNGGDREHGGEGHGRGSDKHERDDNRGRQDRDRPDRNNGRDRQEQRADRGNGNDDRIRAAVRANDDRARQADRRDDRGDDRRVVRDVDRAIAITRDGPVVVLRRDRDRGLIAGCPPGLAKRDNGCLPPGQARQIARARYDYLWDRRDDDFDYRYNDGYLYRLNNQGSLLGYLPVLGGALGLGNPWPAQYAYEPVPRYYQDYYRLNDRSDYRYADGVLYGMDPKTQAITQVAALLTGQQFTVGQPMPSGYDVYNVPYAYRDRYVDGPESLYRYNDGYVYQVDPTTQLVQAVIQLLT